MTAVSNLPDLLRRRAEEASLVPAYTFLNGNMEPCEQVTYADLDHRAAWIGGKLQHTGKAGERALLLYPAGTSFIEAFFGVLYAGWVAVPAYFPTGSHNTARLQSIVRDAKPRIILTTSSLLPQVREWFDATAGIQVIATDVPVSDSEPALRLPKLSGNELALLQYTSGSISTPKGVMVTHKNLLHNEKGIREAFSQSQDSVTVSWLPVYHDMGLIGGIIQPLFSGGRCILLSPLSFLQSPRCWLETISRYKATTSGGPNFAYDLCSRRISESDCANLDLSSWTVAFNGSEPIHSRTIHAFTEKFRRYGFQHKAFYSCYGLAEATLFVAGGTVSHEPVIKKVSSAGLQNHRACEPVNKGDAVELVSSGHPRQEKVIIVDPRTRRACAAGAIGEIWVSGKSIARGYWKQTKSTEQTFHAQLSNKPAGRYLRTGDLGFLAEGELFVTGRLKDIVIIRGRNYYPQDLELTAENSHRGVRAHSSAAFSVTQVDREALVVVCEISHGHKTELGKIADAVRRSIAEVHEIQVADVVLVRAGGVPKTSSGKIQRLACRTAYLKNELPVLQQSRLDHGVSAQETYTSSPGLTRKTLADLPAEERLSALRTDLCNQIAHSLRVPENQVDGSLPLTALGLDSLAAVELSHALEKNLKVSLGFGELHGASIEQLAVLIEKKIESQPISISPYDKRELPKDGSVPLSYGQRALWFLHRLAPESPAYNIAAAVKTRSPIDVSALHRALKLLVRQHAALRTEFFGLGDPVQRIHENAEFEFKEHNAASLSETELLSVVGDAAARPFTLHEKSLLRVDIYQRRGESVLLLVIHHIVSDFWSMAVLARDLGILYSQESRGGPAISSTSAVEYWQYALAINDSIEGTEGQRLKDYWMAKLRDLPPSIDLPYDKPRQRRQTYNGSTFQLEIEAALTSRIQLFSKSFHTSQFVSLLAAFYVLLYRYTGQQDIAVGSPAAARGSAELADTVGYFANPIVLRADLGDSLAFAEFVQQVGNTVAEGLDHQDLPFSLLTEMMNAQRKGAHSPLFQVAFVFHKSTRPQEEAFGGVSLGVPGVCFQLGDLSLASLGLQERGSQFDLTLRAAEIGGRLFCSFLHNSDLFEQETIAMMARHYRNVLEEVIAAPEQLVSHVNLLSRSEREQLLQQWNTGEIAGDSAGAVHALFEEKALRIPHAIALICGEQYLSYGELNHRANRLAQVLQKKLIATESIVGICLGRGVEMVIAMLGTLKAGGVYVPIDPAYPRERQEFMLADSGAKILLTEKGREILANDLPVLVIDELEKPKSVSAGNEYKAEATNQNSGRNLAWIIYTSGSTGRPKGVGVEHHGAISLLNWAGETFTDDEMQGVLASTSWCFDLSAFEIWAPLVRGGTAIIVENALQLSTIAERARVRLINSVPSAVQELVRQNAIPGNVEVINLAGETLTRPLVEKLQGLGHVRRVLNLYGPTEDTTYSTWAEIGQNEEVPEIGKPVNGSRAYVLDDKGELLPPGIVGEIYLGGAGLARGYVDRPGLTAEKFVPDPFSSQPGQRLYRTGDRGRYRRDGDLEYHGRTDQQIKLRGFRIELGEIEARLEQSPGVRESVVALKKLPSGDPQLVAYLVLENAGISEIKGHLQQSLPVSMVPGLFVELASLPRTSNGKVNRKALPEPEWKAQGQDFVPPGSRAEEAVAAIWQEVLGREAISVDADFFELGGHSLLATRVVSRIHEAFNVDIPLRRFFENSTVSKLVQLIVVEQGCLPGTLPELVRQKRPPDLPLSFAQERLWFLEQLDPDNLAYNVPVSLSIQGPLSAVATQQAFAEIVRRHESLRTCFQIRENLPVQEIQFPRFIALPVVDLSRLRPPQQKAEVERLGQLAALQTFDLKNGPLIRLHLLRLSITDHVLLLTLHHIICDGWSFDVLARKFGQIYPVVSRGEAIDLPELSIQYADYALWQRHSLEGDLLTPHLHYWKETLAGLLPLDLPLDRIRQNVPGPYGETSGFVVGRDALLKLNDLARRSGATLFMVLLAAWQIVLARFSRQTDVVVGSPIAGRNRRNTEELIGCLVNTLVLRTNLGGDPGFNSLLRQVREVALEAFAHQELPFEKLVEELQPQRIGGRTPLFDVSFALQNTPLVLSAEGLKLRQAAVRFDRVKFDLSLTLTEAEEVLQGELAFRSELFDRETIERLESCFQNVLNQVAENSSRKISQFALLTREQQDQVLHAGTSSGGEYANSKTITDLFEEQTVKTPDAVAIVAERVLTYRELNQCANQLARCLLKRGINSEALVGIFLERSEQMVIALLGVLKAGGAYLPLDTGYPAERLQYMLQDAEVKLVITQESLVKNLGDPINIKILCVNRDKEDVAAEKSTNPARKTNVENLAYLIYTSGSTGKPKGTAVTHENVQRLLAATDEWFHFSAADTWTLFHSHAFDFSVWEIWGSLLYGGRLVIVPYLVSRSPEEFWDLLEKEKVTVLNQTPSAFRQLVEADEKQKEKLKSLRLVIFGGEALDLRHLQPWWDRYGDRGPELINMYGITETTVHVTYKALRQPEILKKKPGSPIGTPIPDLQVYVLEPNGELAPFGVYGEMYVGGAGVSRGYLKRQELTAERFIPDRFSGKKGARLYRTGDLARQAENGELEYLGRIDHQVKIRGFRIELGEIEALLKAHWAVKESVVVAWQEDGDTRLIGYVVPSASEPAIQPSGLREYLRGKLPEYMVPVGIVELERLPLTTNGKLDIKALPQPKAQDPNRYVAPRTAIEEMVANVWAEVLKQNKVSIEANFFEIGGHSLLATRVTSRLRELFQVELSLRDFFNKPTVALTALQIEQARGVQFGPRPPALVMSPRESTVPLSFGQERIWFLEQLEPGTSANNIAIAMEFRGRLSITALEQAVAAIASRHESLRTVFLEIDGRPIQQILPSKEQRLPVIDLRQLGSESAARAQATLTWEESEEVFDLRQGPLFRSTLLQRGPDVFILLLTFHHIVSDGWSLGVFSRELTALYQDFATGVPCSLQPLALQYADYCYWQRKWMQGSVLEEHVVYWRNQLGEAPPVLELPTDRPRPNVRTIAGTRHNFTFREKLVQGVQEISNRSGSSRFMTLFSGFAALLSRYSGQTDFCIGTFIANRNRVEVEGLVGFFVNNLALRVDISDQPSFRTLVNRVRETTLGAYAHQDLPFEKILDDLRLARSQKHTPLFQTMFVLQNTPEAKFHARDIQADVIPADGARSNFEITLWVEEHGGLRAALEYNKDLFDAITIERMAGHLCRLLDSAVSNWEQKIHELPLLNHEERRQILNAGNTSTQPFNANIAVHQLFEEQVARSPKAIAIAAGEVQVTYEELNQLSNRIAHKLLAMGAQPERFVGLLAERSPETIAALLGILKAGCGYVPLDTRLPAERMHYMLDDSGAFILLAQQRFLHLAPDGMNTVALDDAEKMSKYPASNPSSGVFGGNAAYVIYTSGSTGKPKSVLVEHRSLVNHTLAAVAHHAISAADRVLQFASLSFDASAEEIYPCLIAGGSLVLRTDAMLASPVAFLKACEQWGVTVLDLPTAYWHALAAALETDIPALPSCLRMTILGGERALPQRAFLWVRASAPGARLVNTYGPTEATIVATQCDVTEMLRSTAPVELPIGWPIANVRTYVLDENLEPVPFGVSGQLHIGGAGLARQYMHRPETTAEKFIPNPFAQEPGELFYQSGDYVRKLRNGSMEFVGRKDRQVKIRGNRIELSEIETRLSEYSGVQEAAVIPWKDSGVEQYLAAYLVSNLHPEVSEVRSFLKSKLPEYMVPSVIVYIDQMPLTPAGKLDVSRLPVPSSSRPDLAREFVAPRTPTEEILGGIWSEVLGIPQVSMKDTFFDLGGYSLLATQVIARIREVFSIELPLSALFESKTLEELAVQIAETSRNTVPKIEPVSREVDLPLSFAQERIWFITQLDRKISSYHVPRATRATGQLNFRALQDSYAALVRRHEILRTTFTSIEGKPVQRIHKAQSLPIDVVDISTLRAERKEALLSQVILEAGQQLFDIEQGPLIRVRLVRLSEHEHVIVQTEHHLVHDGWAEGVLTRDLLGFYSAFTEGRPPELPPLLIQFADFAAWQRNWMQGDVLKTQLEFWKETLAGAPPLLNLPTDYPRPALQSFKGAEEELRLPMKTIDSLREMSRQAGATLFMTACAAYLALLHRYSGEDDLVLGTVLANRSQHETEGLLGMILNTLPLRTSLGNDPTLRQLLGRVRQACLMAYANQDVPFEKLVDMLRPERNLSYSPIFQVMFAFHDAPRPSLELPGLSLQSIDAHNRSAKFDMLVISSTSAEGMTSLFEYNTDLFEAGTIRRFVRQYSELLNSMPHRQDQKLSELEYLPQEELLQVLYAFNKTTECYPGELCLHQLFEEQVERTPDAVALATASGELTYAGLNGCANRLARRLRELGVKNEQRIAIYSHRSAEMVLGILAVLKAGGAYVPIDPAYPSERQQFILKDSAARFVLVQRSLSERLSKANVVNVFLDDCIAADFSSHDDLESLPPASTQKSLAYLIYTSGSTGTPKGVAIEHHSAVTLTHWASGLFNAAEVAGTLASTSICFDLSIFELFLPLSLGGKILLVDNVLHLNDPWIQGQVTLINTVPSGIAELIATSRLPLSVSTVCLAGEPLRGELVKKIYAHKQVKRVLNLYGPSEATTYSTFSEVHPAENREPCIGGPIANTQAYVLDGNFRSMPIGVPGELFIGGDGVARGYLERPELTARQFVPDSFGKPGSRLYRTGDLARWNARGFLEFLGRIDHQVKIRGYRIEPGEIEAALRANASIRDCAVVSYHGTPDELRLVAYVVTGSKAIVERDLREYLRGRLPDYMVPFSFVFLEALPLTPNGKLDLKALPAPQSVAGANQETVVPMLDLEGSITAIWKEILGREDVGTQSNFFDLGGHSLLLMRVHYKMREELGLADLELIDLFKYPTVQSIAKHLARHSHSARHAVSEVPGTQPMANEHAIAIIGMAGRFPGAANIRQFWNNLCAGTDSISRFTEAELEIAGVDQELLRDSNYVRAKGIIQDVELFDADFFEYSPREAEVMDPQQRIYLECAWEVFEDAGYDPFGYQGTVGVYAGAAMSSYWQNLYTNPELLKLVTLYHAKLGNDKDYLPTRISYKLNLRGPSVNVQTACSTSLVAVHMACRSLIYGECDMAMAGGVSVMAQQKSGYLFNEGGIHSPDGICRAFDAKAQGTVGGNGVGVVLLKRLSDAKAAGDHIYAVIKGSALDNDGSEKIGYTAPSITGQARVITQALAYAGVAPATVSYIETHGTGTVLGDPIEVAALNEAFAPHALPQNSCAIGSLKTNIGHLDAAAGVAGLIKTALALKHRKLPASLHYEQPNPKIDFARGPFFVNGCTKDWEAALGPRRAGVSSFGIGGTNAHAILEEAPTIEAATSSRPWQLLLLSARTGPALDALTEKFRVFLEQTPDISLADVAYTLQVGRRNFPHRRMLICRDRDEASQILSGHKPELLLTETHTDCMRSVVWMFPGAGTQRVNMGLELYRTEKFFQQIVDECAQLFLPHLGLDLRDVLYPGDNNPEEATLKLESIAFNFASIFTIECALAGLWREWGIEPAAMIGHSLGEYTAAYIAGVFSLADAVRLVAARGRLVSTLPAGAMLSVAASEEKLGTILSDGLCLAAVNGENQCVVSGPVQAINELAQVLEERNISTVRLRTDRALHSAALDPILKQFAEETVRVQYRSPRIPFISGVTGTWITEAEAIDPAYWVRHLRQPVQFDAGLRAVLQDSSRVLIEIGPGRALASLAQRNPARKLEVTVFSALRSTTEQLSETACNLKALGRGWLAGINPDWGAFHKNEPRVRVSLPTYPFERQYYWVKPGEMAAPAASVGKPLAKKKDVADWFYVRSWKRTSVPAKPEASEFLRWLVFADQSSLCKRLIQSLKKRGQDVVTIEAGNQFRCLDPDTYHIGTESAEDYRRVINQLTEANRGPQRVLYAWALTPDAWTSIYGDGFGLLHSFLWLVQSMGALQPAETVEINILASGLQMVAGKEKIVLENASILGPCTVIQQEFPNLFCRAIDVDRPGGLRDEEQLADYLTRELFNHAGNNFVAYRENARWVENFEQIHLNDAELGCSRLRKGGTYLILGGLGQIGLTLASFLAKEFQARLVLVQRSPVSTPGSHQSGTNNKSATKLRKIAELEKAGSDVLVLSADLANESQMRNVVEQTRNTFGNIHGVIHCAGIVGELAHRSLEETEKADFDRQFASKVYGLRTLAKVLEGMDLDFCMLSSSLSSVLGGLGYYAYSAANTFMDVFAQQSRQTLGLKWTTVNWDAWAMPGNTAEAKGLGTGIGQLAILPEEASAVFQRVLSAMEIPQLLVSTSDLRRRVASWTNRRSVSTQSTGVQATHARPALRNTYVAPQAGIEQTIAGVLQEMLGIGQIGTHDNFFELGGDSLLATQTVARMRNKLGLNFPLRAFLENPTIASFFAALQTNSQTSETFLGMNAGPLRASAPIDQELEELSRLSEDEVEALIQTKTAIQR